MDSSSSKVKIIMKCFVKPKTLTEKWKEPYQFLAMDHLMAALRMHQAVNEHTDEKITSEMDQWLKYHFKIDRIYCPNLVHMGAPPRFNMYGCEFGMRKAVAARSGYGSKFDGKVSAYSGREGGGSIDVEVCLLPEFMEALESDQEFMFILS